MASPPRRPSKQQDDTLTRGELRLLIAAILMHAEIAAARGAIDDNSELAARGLRRADSLLQQHEESGGKEAKP